MRPRDCDLHGHASDSLCELANIRVSVHGSPCTSDQMQPIEAGDPEPASVRVENCGWATRE